jgi:thiamine phosphate synthase YjbQ (UPF0047 family)
VEIDEKNEEVKKLSLKEKVKKGAKLVFEKGFNEKILISAEEKDGGEDKEEAGKVKEFDSFKIVFDKDGHGHAGPGHHVDIKTVVQELAKVDWRWHISRDDDDEKDHVFQSLFDAHVMVALSERVPETGNGKEKLEEVARCKLFYRKKSIGICSDLEQSDPVDSEDFYSINQIPKYTSFHSVFI